MATTLVINIGGIVLGVTVGAALIICAIKAKKEHAHEPLNEVAAHIGALKLF